MLADSGHTATYRSSVTANMHLIGERYFLYRHRIVIVCSVTGPLTSFVRSVRESMAGFFAQKTSGKYFPVPTSHSINKS